jgi:hypothetical protein
VVIVCASHVAAGYVIMLLLGEGLPPRTHYRVDQIDHDDGRIRITIVSQLSVEQAARLRAGIATIFGASIH